MIQMHSLPRARSAAVALATVAIPLPLHLVGHWHRPNAWHPPAHAKHLRTARRHPKAHRARLPVVSSHTWRLAFPAVPAHPHAPTPSNPRAHAANDPSDTISDFEFTPSSLTIHVGDTVTWTNDDPVSHTATAYDGAFNTGTLQKGQSDSHTFSQAGTFTYYCRFHTFMHGTIVVLAASTSSTTSNHSSSNSNSNNSSTSNTGNSGSSNSSNSSNSGSTSSSQSSSTSSSTLPVTGLNLIATLCWAAGLIGAGVVLRRGSRA